nr:hypothetical protein [Brevibacillus laterosporus]
MGRASGNYLQEQSGLLCSVDADTDFDEEYEYTLSNEEELIDWAANNMNWEDVEKFAH